MSGPGEGNGRSEEAGEAAGVLANLPRTRPHRATARRDAARRSAAAAQEDPGPANGNGRTPRKAAAKTSKSTGSRASGTARAGAQRTGAAKPKARPKAAKTPRREPEAVPRQGYESVEDRATGPVQPPGGTELLGTAAEIVGELAKAGVSSGERLLRDVFSRLGR